MKLAVIIQLENENFRKLLWELALGSVPVLFGGITMLAFENFYYKDRGKNMFASEEGKKLFLGIMVSTWVVVLLSWIFSNVFCTVSLFYPHQIVIMALLLFLCYSKPQRKVWEITFPILTEALLIAIPILSCWTTIIFLYMLVKYENIISSRQAITTLHWLLFAVTFLPVITFPLLRRWSRAEIQ